MTTQEVANKLVELCRAGQIPQVIQELFADDVKSTEPSGDNPTVKGKAEVIKKSEIFASRLEEVHNSVISDPLVIGTWFSISWLFDVTMKGQGRITFEEICVYQVKDGKVVSEQFFF